MRHVIVVGRIHAQKGHHRARFFHVAFERDAVEIGVADGIAESCQDVGVAREGRAL